ncbi:MULTISPECIES: class I SAM-dependent methyltransferase [unclassified Nonomuraea]|uniref:class I SAM-dependent methyltransferase n=1 Tax=unclassified Nonomuraea TaxID=2593643 RepID=UPI00340CB145
MLEIRWTEDGEARSARWRSENGSPPPARVVIADERLAAATAYRLACEGTALLWRGDFHAARRLLRAMARRADRRPPNLTPTRPPRPSHTPSPPPASWPSRSSASPPALAAADPPAPSLAQDFHQYRRARSQRAVTLGRLLVPLDPDHSVPLRRAPDVRGACAQVYGPATEASVISLRELLGIVGADEWRRRGVEVPALNDRIHPHYGVFSPVRGEYVDLVAAAPLVSRVGAFDIGTGTGVLAAVLARRGVQRVVATDRDPRAVACARDNLRRLGLSGRVDVLDADLFPPGRAPLAVCNPPWLPAKPVSPLDHAVYDPGSRMLRGFLDGLGEHLTPEGEGWLILSDLAERLGLRTRADLLSAFTSAGLRVVDQLRTRPRHPRASDRTDPLHAARATEITSLWRLRRT